MKSALTLWANLEAARDSQGASITRPCINVYVQRELVKRQNHLFMRTTV